VSPEPRGSRQTGAPQVERVRIRVGATIELEGRWDLPERPSAGVVLCHPHPLHRGTMTVPLLEAITRFLVARSAAVLRFNFRGVGRSTGAHDEGLGEIDDVAAAMEHAAGSFPRLGFGIAGWSFGAATALRWQARDRSENDYVGIAPGAGRAGHQRLPDPAALPPARRTFIVGDRDQLIPVDELVSYARRCGAHLEVIAGSDHFFYFREQAVAGILATGLGIDPEGDSGFTW
jgi:alpha/beta superfamily hydrolase